MKEEEPKPARYIISIYGNITTNTLHHYYKGIQMFKKKKGTKE
jgi:hypothetical protein